MKLYEQTIWRVFSPSSQKSGFTLVELLGAVAVIAFLAGIAVFSIMEAVTASQVQAIQKQEQELNLAWQNQRSLGAPDTTDLETAIGHLMTTQSINGTEMARTMVAEPPRTMYVGNEERLLTFIGREFRYHPQSIEVGGTPLPTPTPEPTPEATPAEMVTITVNPLPEWSAPGSTSKTGSFQVEKGSVFTVTAIPAPGSKFIEWMLGTYDGWENWEGLASLNFAFTVSGDQELTPYFQPDVAPTPTPAPTPIPTPTPAPLVTITIKAPTNELGQAHPEAGYTNMSPGEYQVEPGTDFSVTAFAETGWSFWGWAESGDQNPTTSFTATTNRTLTPRFNATPMVQVRIAVQGETLGNGPWGTVTVTPGLENQWTYSEWEFEGYVPDGGTIQLHARPNPGYKFVGWRGAVYMDTEDQDLSYSATWSAQTITAMFVEVN